VKLSLERYLFVPDQILPAAPTSPQALCVAMDKSKKCLSQGQLDQGPSFDDELLEHGMQVFACQTDLTELQVDWNSSGPGLVKHEVGTREQCQVQDQKPVYSRGERVLLGGLKTVSMNGQAGTITTLLASGRYGVLLSDGGKIAVRPCHLQPLHGRRHCLLNDLQCHWR
jgi:hypothetical protein